jgi:hypothetical protein
MALFPALALVRILLRRPKKGTEHISSQDWIGHGGVDAENINLRVIPIPKNSRTGVVVKNGCNEVIKALLWFHLALKPEK